MSDLLAIGSSALLAYRKALDNTGHNIANVHTEGYSRQRVTLQAQGGVAAGNGFAGNGVSAISTQRIHDQFIQTRLLGDTSDLARLDTLSPHSARLDGLLSDTDSGLAQPLQSFFSSLSALSANPTDTGTRQTVLGQAQTLANRFQDLHSQINAQGSEIEQRLTQTTSEINQYAKNVAGLNQRIAQEHGKSGGQPPNDLMDQRDLAVQALAERLGITTVTESDGSLSVFTGSGQALVQGQSAYTLGTRDDGSGTSRLDIVHGSGASAVAITGQISGGKLGGLLDARRELIQPALAQLDLVATELASAVNAQHRLGNDLSGAAGVDLFVPVTGAADMAVALADARQIAAASGTAAANSSDNVNARALSALAQNGRIALNGDTFAGAANRLVTDVGIKAQSAQLAKDAAAAVQTRTQAEQSSVSGVSLDEEAADLLRYQQAYQAAAQVIATANTVFESLLSAARR